MFVVTDRAAASCATRIGAGKDLDLKELKLAIADLLEEAMDNPSVPVSEWTDAKGREFFTIEISVEGIPMVAAFVDSYRDNYLHCLYFVTRYRARRLVMSQKWAAA